MGTQVNEISIRYKERIPAPFWKQIKCSKDATELLFQTWNKDTIAVHESFKIVLLNNSNKVKGIYQISQGGITGTLVDLRILFAVVLKTLSVGILLAHNHPSGKLQASQPDKDITQKIQRAAQLFDVKVLDHIILAPDGKYYSFADQGVL
ncbi:JAB domain-containing protein [Allomuricauda sp. F6463D]|uniref:JAB domain-containing protein n=1 Tax=Allomuricauda sp. F6463D TaxID=2926409 RepID=UPI001FF503BF|nr:JAB domain-containing protein [Muricauda sp. F6463D]MCK0160449.1 JAB domain-containing protein [Muricauda sp. F6463D]